MSVNPVTDCLRHRPERPDALPVVLALLPAESLRAICQEGRKFDETHPRFKVRWDDKHETVLVPGPDVSVESGS